MPGVDVEVAEEPISPDEMVGAVAEAPPEDEDPFREPLGDVEVGSPERPAAVENASAEEEEIFDDSPAPPSWDDVVENCRGIAGATGAMIIDPVGQVFAASGWRCLASPRSSTKSISTSTSTTSSGLS